MAARGRRRRGRYKMTPRRRAALRKAQAASARKRRFSGVKNAARITGQIGGTIAVGAVLWHVEGYARDLPRAYRHSKTAGRWIGSKLTGKSSSPALGTRKPINPYQLGPLRTRNVRRITTRQRRAVQGRLF